jgi:cytochrome c5
MKRFPTVQLLSLTAGPCLLACAVIGCQSATGSQPNPAPASANTTPAMLSADDTQPNAPPAKGRAQIWAETCNRCHNTRSPDSYSGKEWAVVMTHMRVRGYLTGEDQRAIQEFLQSQ